MPFFRKKKKLLFSLILVLILLFAGYFIFIRSFQTKQSAPEFTSSLQVPNNLQIDTYQLSDTPNTTYYLLGGKFTQELVYNTDRHLTGKFVINGDVNQIEHMVIMVKEGGSAPVGRPTGEGKYDFSFIKAEEIRKLISPGKEIELEVSFPDDEEDRGDNFEKIYSSGFVEEPMVIAPSKIFVKEL